MLFRGLLRRWSAGPSRWLFVFLVGTLAGRSLAADPRPPAADDTLKQIVKEINLLRVKIGDDLKSGEVHDQQTFDRYYELNLQLLVLPSNLTRLHLTRQSIKKDLGIAGSAAVPDVHDRINSLLLAKLPDVASGDFVPAMRANAMLLLADLDAQELKGGVGIAAPLPAALPKLLEAYRSPDQIDAVRVAALFGIVRHAEAGIADNDLRSQVLDDALQTAAAKAAPVGRSEQGHRWFRRRAAEVLGALGVTGTDKDATRVVQVLAEMVEDRTAPLALRADAAKALGRLKLESQSNLNLSQLAEFVAALAVDIAKQETSRRGLRHYLNAVEASLKGPPPAASKPGEEPKAGPPGGISGKATADPHKEYVAGVVAALDPLFKLVVDEKVPDDELTAKVESAADDLATWLEEHPPAAQGVVAGTN